MIDNTMVFGEGLRLHFSEDAPLELDLTSWIYHGCAGVPYDFEVRWGDGTRTKITDNTEDFKHTYLREGDWEWDRTVTIVGSFPAVTSSLDPCAFANIEDFPKAEEAFLNSFRKYVLMVEVVGDGSPLRDFLAPFAYFTNLLEIDERIFDNCTASANGRRMFYRCESMESYPANLLRPLGRCRVFRDAFGDNKSLRSIPSGFFAKCRLAVSFYNCFSGCYRLADVPEDFAPHYTKEMTLVLDGMFMNSGITSFSFKENFNRMSRSTTGVLMFANCPNLKNIEGPEEILLSRNFLDITLGSSHVYGINVQAGKAADKEEKAVNTEPKDEAEELIDDVIPELAAPALPPFITVIREWCREHIEGYRYDYLVKESSGKFTLCQHPWKGCLVCLTYADFLCFIGHGPDDNPVESMQRFLEKDDAEVMEQFLKEADVSFFEGYGCTTKEVER